MRHCRQCCEAESLLPNQETFPLEPLARYFVGNNNATATVANSLGIGIRHITIWQRARSMSWDWGLGLMGSNVFRQIAWCQIYDAFA